MPTPMPTIRVAALALAEDAADGVVDRPEHDQEPERRGDRRAGDQS